MTNPRELLLSGLAGAAATAVDFAGLLVLLGQHVPVALATFVGSLAGAVVGFVLNKQVAFRDRAPIDLRKLLRYQLAAVASALLMAVVLKLLVGSLGVPIVPAKLAGAVVVFALWTYPVQRRFVFAPGAARDLDRSEPPIRATEPVVLRQLSRGA